MKKTAKIGLVCAVILTILAAAGGIFLFSQYRTVMAENGFEQDRMTLCVDKAAVRVPQKRTLADYTWSTSDPSIVTVENGRITTKAAGTAIVTASRYWYRFAMEVTVTEHDCNTPTCEKAAVCRVCRKVVQQALGHSFSAPTCIGASKCVRCGAPGEKPALGHELREATCEEASKCIRCEYTEGEALGHIAPRKQDCAKETLCERCGKVIKPAGQHLFEEATCTKPKTCTICKQTEGEKLGHSYSEATCIRKATCERCGKQTGSFAAHYYVETGNGSEMCAYCGRSKLIHGSGSSSSQDPGDIAAFCDRVLELINEERAKEGLGAVTMDETLVEVAILRANEITQLFEHERPDGSSCFTAYEECRVSYRAAGENIAVGYETPEAVMEGWMNSPGHRANILDPVFGRVGVGLVILDDSVYRYYWSQNFAD